MLEIDIEKRIVNGVWEGYIGRVNRQSIRVFTGKRMSGVELTNFFASGSLDNTKLKVYGPDGPIYLTYESIDISSPGSVAAYSPRVFVEERTLERFIDNFDQYVEGSSGVAKAAAQEALDAKDQLTTDVSQALSTLNEDKQTAINELNQVKESNRKRYLDPVATVTERDSAYPTPENGDSVWVSGEGKMYRYNGTEWKVTNENDPSAIDMVNQQLADIVVNVKSFGANGDDVLTDTKAIKDSINQARQIDGSVLFFPSNKKPYLTNETIFIPPNISVKMDGVLSYVGEVEQPCLTIGEPSSYISSKIIEVNVERSIQSSWTDDNSVGVVVINADSCNMNIKSVKRFAIGAQFIGSSKGFAYNEVSFGKFVNNKIHVDCTNENGGWCNENYYTGGRFTNTSTTHPDVSRYGVRITSKDGSYIGNNNNVFMKPSFELQVPTTGEAVPILIEHGIQNTFKEIRNENNSNTTAIIKNKSTENEITSGYGGVVISERGEFSNNFRRGSRNKVVDNSNNVIFTTGPLHKNACYYNGSTRVHVPGVHVSQASTHLISSDLITISEEYLEIGTSRGLGVFVNTKEKKNFVIRRDVERDNPGRVAIRCYGYNGQILTSSEAGHPYVKGNSSLTPTYAPNFGGVYRMAVDNSSDWFISLSDEVAYIDVICTGGTNPLRIRSFSVISVDGGSPSVWNGFEKYPAGVNVAIQAPSVGTWGTGRIVINAEPSELGETGSKYIVEGWTCVMGGTPGTWVEKRSYTGN